MLEGIKPSLNISAPFDLLKDMSEEKTIQSLFLKFGNGVCIRSYVDDIEIRKILEIIDLCSAGEHGKDLIRFPSGSDLNDQPDVFFDIRSIVLSERFKSINKMHEANKDVKKHR